MCRNLPQAEAALDAGADGVYLDFLDLVGTAAAVRALRSRALTPHVTLAAPRIRKPGEERIDHYIGQLAPDAILVRSLGGLHAGQSGDVPRIADFSLNVTNKLSAGAVLGRGVAAFTPSFDLDADQLTALLDPLLAPFAEVVVHHPMPLFHMEHCVIAALLSKGADYRTCGRPCEAHQVSLRDRIRGPAPSRGGRGLSQHGVSRRRPERRKPCPGAHGARGPALPDRAGSRGAEDAGRIIGVYRALIAARTTAADAWRELKTLKADGGYGVVRGSLRVLS